MCALFTLGILFSLLYESGMMSLFLCTAFLTHNRAAYFTKTLCAWLVFVTLCAPDNA